MCKALEAQGEKVRQDKNLKNVFKRNLKLDSLSLNEMSAGGLSQTVEQNNGRNAKSVIREGETAVGQQNVYGGNRKSHMID